MATQSSLTTPTREPVERAGRAVLVADLDERWAAIVRTLEAEGIEFDLLSPRTSSSDVVACTARDGGVLILDLAGDPTLGMAMVAKCRQAAPHVPLIVVADHPSVELTRSIRTAGAFCLAPHPATAEDLRSVLAAAFDALKAEAPGAIASRTARRILVVDDDDDFRASTATLLESFGYEVDTAASGRDGLRLLNDAPPDLVVLDVMMENDDTGYEVTEAIKYGNGQEPVRHIPVVMVSSIPQDPFTRFSRSEEIDLITPNAYLTKPLDIPQFLSEVRTLLGQDPADRGRESR